jgi:hypothetical protein
MVRPRLLCSPHVERLSARRVHSCRHAGRISRSRRALAGILLAFVVCPSCWSACRCAAWYTRFGSRIRRVRAYPRSTPRTMACVVTVEPGP